MKAATQLLCPLAQGSGLATLAAGGKSETVPEE